MKTYLFLFLLTTAGACTEYTVATNKIITATDHQMGVVAPDGKLLIDTVYPGVFPLYSHLRQTLPPNEELSDGIEEFYLVRNAENQLALFNNGGTKVFGFVDAERLAVDEHTKTIVKTVVEEGSGERSYLYGFNGKPVFESSFRSIAYVTNSDLIALIAQDGATREYYLYNPFTEAKLGPYSHFNIYNADSETPIGMITADFQPYKELNIITVRETRGESYVWGVIDMQGQQVYPVAYKYFRIIDHVLRKRFIDKAEKPEGVEYLFYAHFANETSQMMLFDKNMSRYVLESGLNKISKLHD